tara:strand:+ start:9504 stop:9734 length:231 start_codon:yes stop_codon:yes gene_type:complete
MSLTKSNILEYELSENNIIIVHYDIHSQQQTDDGLTQALETTEITEMMLNNESVSYNLYDLLHEDIYEKINEKESQ